MFIWLLSLLISVFYIHRAEACTAFQLKSQDGAVIYCRSLEFGFPLDSDLLIVPRNTMYTGTAPQEKPGLSWTTKYGYVGMNQSIDRTLVSDGMNEEGLVVGLLYLPGYAHYEKPDPAREKQTLGPWELGSFLLGTCASIQDVKTALSAVLVAQEPVTNLGNYVMPLHYYISDRKGEVLIVEYVNGQRHEFKNPLGVLTNSPPFDWQTINLSNYVNLSPVNVPHLKFSNYDVQNFGQGSGLLGLPGDYTPVSRFIRATFFSQWATEQKTALETIRLGFHILNTFDIFDGIILSKSDHIPINSKKSDTTEWVIVHDKKNLKTYMRSDASLQIQMLDLKKIDFSATGFKKVSLKKEFQVEDETNKIQSLQIEKK